MPHGSVILPYDVIATWPPPNLENPVLRGPVDTVISIIFMVLAAIAVSIRLYTRWQQRKMHSEDWCILLGLVFTVIMCICILVAYHQYKFDRHIWDAYPYFQLLVKGKKVSD
jgi:membrane protein YdbS with pleckstrin-like domain